MKIARIVSFVVLLSVLFSFQVGQIQAYDGSSDLKISDSIEYPDLGLKTNKAPVSSTSNSPALVTGPLNTGSCHFGITVPWGLDGYDLSILGVDSYLDWGMTRNSAVASNIQYYMGPRVRDSDYAWFLQTVKSLLATNKGLTWIIGNEPDYEATGQDNITAESYGERFYEMATAIRTLDPTAKIAFGTIIQPTPIRLEYLDKAIARLITKASENGKTKTQALGLIDIYSIHAFNLNELPLLNSDGTSTNNWGAGVPKGFDQTWKTWGQNYVLSSNEDAYDINIFKSRIIAFRDWMGRLGEQAKPLWVTEYGSLFTTKAGVSDQTSADYMKATFDFMLAAKNQSLGYPGDDYRLVQKWMWYSLNDNIKNFGGSLYNPITHQMTAVFDQFIKYDPSTIIPVNLSPDVYIDPNFLAIRPGLPGNYKVTVKVGNTVSSDRLTGVKVDLLLGSTVVGSVQANLPRCAGILPVSFNVPGLLAGQSYAFTAQVSPSSGYGTDIDHSNDGKTFPAITMPIILNVMMPFVSK